MPTPIFLIGYMGSGKTTLAKKLSNKMLKPYVDLDAAIVEEVGMPIAAYFALYGEEAFRLVERDFLRKYAEQDIIISTGGGVPCFFDNMDWINANGYSVYLQMSPKALYDRLSQSKIEKRPILKGLSGDNLQNFIREKLAERSPYYEKAHYIVDQINMDLEALADHLQHISV